MQTDTIAYLARTRRNGWVEPAPPTCGSRLERIIPAGEVPGWVGLAGALIDEGDDAGARAVLESGIRARLECRTLVEDGATGFECARPDGHDGDHAPARSAADVIERVRDRVLGLEADEALRIIADAAEEAPDA